MQSTSIKKKEVNIYLKKKSLVIKKQRQNDNMKEKKKKNRYFCLSLCPVNSWLKIWRCCIMTSWNISYKTLFL